MSQIVLYLGLGLAAGVLYAGVGVGVVTTFKATGVVNLAQVGFGMWGAFTFAVLRQDGRLVLPIPGIPTPSLGGPATTATAMVIALAMSALLGAASYLLVFRPLRGASTVANLVASTGLLAVIQSLIVLQFGTAAVPVDRFLPEGGVRVLGASVPLDRLWAAGITVVIALALAAWFRWTRTGLALRGASESQFHVALARWSPSRLALIGWTLGAMVSALLTMLVAPAVSLSPVAFGLLIVPGLAAALIGRLSSVLAACAGGLGLGVAQALIANWSTKDWWPDFARVGVAQLVPFLAVAVVLTVLGSRLPFRGDPIGARLPAVRPSRPRPVVVAAVAALGVLALVATGGSYRFGLITSMALAVLALSIVVLTGYTGQLSLAQAAVAGVGGFTIAKFGTGIPFPLNLLLAALVASVVGVLIGAPALRIRGAQLTIVSMAGAVALESLVFKNPSFASQSGEMIPAPSLFGIDLAIRRGNEIARLPFGLTVLVVLVLSGCAVACIAAGRTGRRFFAVRGDERAAAAAGIDVARTKLVALATASFVAGLAGGLLGMVRGQLTADSFTLFVGIAAVAYVTIGGITRVAGAVIAGALGALGIVYVVLDQSISFGKWYGLASGVALVASVVQNPDGLAANVAERLRALRARRAGPEPAHVAASGEPEASPTASTVAASADGATTSVATAVAARAAMDAALGSVAEGATLTVSSLGVSYGGIRAVSDVSLRVEGGTVLGLVGPNGAGKTSIIDGICGFTASTGSVDLDGVRLDGQRPHQRKRAGLARTWQDGGLFEELTVIEHLAVVADDARFGDLGRDLWSRSGTDRDRLMGILSAWGLDDVADRRPSELSVGRRKLVDIARAVAGDPSVLLADEPAAGLDSWESEELAARLRGYADTGRAVLLIEHDLAFVRKVCDQLVVLDFGSVIASGDPEPVLADPSVAMAYLGLAPDDAGDTEEPLAPVLDIETGLPMGTS
ncbi:MAG: ATP-binding cassette domain-containing protein [Actinomycetota bacterium]|nr:ATP-binding cassette domain-containing protein [Actinomycetota bacterium]